MKTMFGRCHYSRNLSSAPTSLQRTRATTVAVPVPHNIYRHLPRATNGSDASERRQARKGHYSLLPQFMVRPTPKSQPDLRNLQVTETTLLINETIRRLRERQQKASSPQLVGRLARKLMNKVLQLLEKYVSALDLNGLPKYRAATIRCDGSKVVIASKAPSINSNKYVQTVKGHIRQARRASGELPVVIVLPSKDYFLKAMENKQDWEEIRMTAFQNNVLLAFPEAIQAIVMEEAYPYPYQECLVDNDGESRQKLADFWNYFSRFLPYLKRNGGFVDAKGLVA